MPVSVAGKLASVAGAMLGIAIVAFAARDDQFDNELVSIPVPDRTFSARLISPGSRQGPLVIPVRAVEKPSELESSRAERTLDARVAVELARVGVSSLFTADHSAVRLPKAGFVLPSDIAEITALVMYLRNNWAFSSVSILLLDGSSESGLFASQTARTDAFIVSERHLSAGTSRGGADNNVVGSELPRILGISVGADRIGWMNDPATAAQDVKQVLATASFPSHPSKRMSKRTVAVAMVRDAWLTVEHGQPLKRGRSVWEQVVPWKRWWMPGADEVTTLTTSRPLIMNGLYVPRGTFSLYCILGEKLVFILNHRLGQHHKVYDPSLDLGRVPTIRQELDVSNELLTFAIVPTRLGGELKISWDRRLYSVPFEVMR